MVLQFKNTTLLEKSIDAAVMRNEVHNQNIANVDTPGYKKKIVRFEELFNEQQAVTQKGTRTHPRHIPIEPHGLDPTVVEENAWGVARLDQNDVDINVEMAALAKNTIQYNTLIQRLNGKFSTLKNVISDGRR